MGGSQKELPNLKKVNVSSSRPKNFDGFILIIHITHIYWNFVVKYMLNIRGVNYKKEQNWK